MKEPYTFVPIPAESLPMWWEQVAALYQQSAETWADYDKLENIYEQHRLGNRVLYICLNGTEVVFAISGTVQSWPMGRTVVLDWCAGKDVKKFIGIALSSLETMAWQVGAFEVQFVGRDGWRRLLEPFGYRVTHTVYTKRLIGRERSS